MIVVLPGALFQGQVSHVAVISVVGQVGDVMGPDLVEDMAGDRGFAGGRAPGDAEHDGGMRAHGRALQGSKKAIAAVAEAGQDVALVIQTFIEHGRVDFYIGVGSLEGGKAFRRGDDGNNSDLANAFRLQ